MPNAHPSNRDVTFLFTDVEGSTRLMQQALAEKVGAVAGDLDAAFQMLEPLRIEVFGKPGELALAMDKSLVDAGAPYISNPRYVDGFARDLP